MSAAYRKYRDTRFFASLDGLRALSILGVIWTHTWYGTPKYDWLLTMPLLRSGPFGVEVFFTISGFLITTLLLREREKFGTISLRDFYIRRALRIWPLYYAVLGLYVVLVLVFEHGTERGHAFFHFLPAYLTYTYTWRVTQAVTTGVIFNFAWSLSTEEQFYLFWPFALKLLRWWAPTLMFAVIGLFVAHYYGLLWHVFALGTLPERMIGSISVPICIGALLAHALHAGRGFDALYPVLGKKMAAPLAMIFLALSVIPYPSLTGFTWITLPLLIGACVIREDNGMSSILRWRPIAYVGILSYGMYLYNTLVVKMFRPVLGHVGLHHPLLVYPFIVGLTIFIAWLSYRYFESPFLKLKSRFSRVRPPPAAAAPIAISIAPDHVSLHP